MRAIEQDKEAAALQGVNVDRINGLAFGVGFALAAAAGALMAPIFKLDPMMGEQPLLKAFIIIILGGLGSIPGAILGGLMLGLIDSIVATALGAEPAFLLSFVFIILLLLFKPTGLFGHAVVDVLTSRCSPSCCARPRRTALGSDYYVHIFALVFTNVILAAEPAPVTHVWSAEHRPFGVYVCRGLHLGVPGQALGRTVRALAPEWRRSSRRSSG